MKTVRLQGMRPLEGTVTVGGAKNAALPVLFATLLTTGRSIIENLPDIGDVRLALDILRSLGAKVTYLHPHCVSIDTAHLLDCDCADSAARGMRGSVYLLGALLGRRGYATMGIPGGCALGDRPVDRHLNAFRTLGAETTTEAGRITVRASSLTGGRVVFREVSVGATVNALLAAVAAEGVTTVSGAAREPYVACLCRYLIACGARIEGVGTEELTVRGGSPLGGCTFALMGDMMEAGSYLIMGAQTGGSVTVRGADPDHLFALLSVLAASGATVSVAEDTVTVAAGERILPVEVTTGPYPAYPTDLHPQLVSYLLRAEGKSRLRETVWSDRFRYTDQLRRLGGLVTVEGDAVEIRGTPHLHGATVRIPDLRAGAALVGGALSARGESLATGFELVERGYENMVEKLSALGARIGYL